MKITVLVARSPPTVWQTIKSVSVFCSPFAGVHIFFHAGRHQFGHFS